MADNAVGGADAARRARRAQIGRYAVIGVLALWAALVVMTLVLLFDEFTAPSKPLASRAQGAPAASNTTSANRNAKSAIAADARPNVAEPDATNPRNATASSDDLAIRVEPAWLRPAPDTVLTRIAVGSCLHQNHPQPIWDAVIETKPQMFLMLGDNVYGDIRNGDPQELASAYRIQAAQPEFAKARAAMPFLATWDDHDYGKNDAGAGYEFQSQAAEFFRAFWQLPEAKQTDGGIYYARTFGPEGRRIQMIFLDTRTFRSDLKRKSDSFPHWGKYEPDPSETKTVLGKTQWDWLEARLQDPAEIRFIASGVQILANGHGWERWGNIPQERARLKALLARTHASGVILLSGDRHSAALYREAAAPGAAQPQLVELTASSLNRAFGPSKDAQVPPLASKITFRENFGLIDIDWEWRKVLLSVHGIDGVQTAALEVPFSTLGLGGN